MLCCLYCAKTSSRYSNIKMGNCLEKLPFRTAFACLDEVLCICAGFKYFSRLLNAFGCFESWLGSIYTLGRGFHLVNSLRKGKTEAPGYWLGWSHHCQWGGIRGTWGCPTCGLSGSLNLFVNLFMSDRYRRYACSGTPWHTKRNQLILLDSMQCYLRRSLLVEPVGFLNRVQ